MLVPFSVALGVTHHPITIWGLPAYALYILLEQPGFIKNLKMIMLFVASGLLGLAPLLYYVIRSPDVSFGPTDMRTWAGFIRHTTAQGLRVNLFHYGLADLPQRWTVFISLLRLQFIFPFLLCVVLGFAVLLLKRQNLGFLCIVFFVGHLAFTINSVQDVMAYLLHVFVILAVPMAYGVAIVLQWWWKRSVKTGYYLTLVAIFVSICWQLSTRLPLISLRKWDDADVGFAQLVDQFGNKESNAAYVADWEHLTPYYYSTMVEGAALSTEDLRPVYVTGDLSWEQAVFSNLPVGPVYLSNYRREIRDLGFRLRPVDRLWQVFEPPALEPVSPEYVMEDIKLESGIEILGYDLAERLVSPGDVVHFTLYAKSYVSQTEILMPYITLGSVEQRWTTDSRRLTPEWLPGEIIVEQYSIYIPLTIQAGEYSLALHYTNMSRENEALLFTDGKYSVNLGSITVESSHKAIGFDPILDRSLAIISNDICLVTDRVRSGFQFRSGVWVDPLPVKQGQSTVSQFNMVYICKLPK